MNCLTMTLRILSQYLSTFRLPLVAYSAPVFVVCGILLDPEYTPVQEVLDEAFHFKGLAP